MRRANQAKRRASYKFISENYGAERADYLIGEGWIAVYADLEQNGYTWSERDQSWKRSSRPATLPKKVVPAIRRYEYARITVNCPVADIDLVVEAWQQLVDLYGYTVWRQETPGAVSQSENVRLTIFIRRAINEK